MRSTLEEEFFGGVCKHSVGTRALHFYQYDLGFYSSHQCHYTGICIGFVVDSLLCSMRFLMFSFMRLLCGTHTEAKTLLKVLKG